MKIPSFSYPGGKHYQRKWIVSHFPRVVGGTYAEPFAGRGNVFWLAAKTVTAKKWWLNDTKVSRFFEVVKTSGWEDVEEIIGNVYPSLEDYRVMAVSPHSDRSVLLEPWITFSGGGVGQGYRHGCKAPTVAGYKSRLASAAATLRETDALVTDLDYAAVLSSLGGGDFCYLDPPYLGCDVRAYGNDTVDHQVMCGLLKNSSFSWVLSEYDHELYRDSLGEPLSTREVGLKVSGKLTGKTTRRECLWGKLPK